MIEIEYEVREQDLLAFNEHQLRHSESLQKVLRRHQSMVPGILAVIAIFLWFNYQDSLSTIFVGITAVAWGLLAPVVLKRNLLRKIHKLYSDEDKAAMLGTYKLRTTPDALVETTQGGEARMKWADILRVEMTKKYAFIFVSLDSALIIPRTTVKKGDLHEFVKEADQRIEQAS
jgi:hypothetical protein